MKKASERARKKAKEKEIKIKCTRNLARKSLKLSIQEGQKEKESWRG